MAIKLGPKELLKQLVISSMNNQASRLISISIIDIADDEDIMKVAKKVANKAVTELMNSFEEEVSL
jgi:hypothetical protein